MEKLQLLIHPINLKQNKKSAEGNSVALISDFPFDTIDYLNGLLSFNLRKTN